VVSLRGGCSDDCNGRFRDSDSLMWEIGPIDHARCCAVTLLNTEF
jgi:hypothetical protein